MIFVAAVMSAEVVAAEKISAGKDLRWTKRQLLTSPHENATVADLNKDGHPDIISGAFIFDGPNFVPRMYRPNHLAADYQRENSVHAYDVDRDGWPDVIVGSWGEEGITWYKNPGNSVIEQKKPWEMHQPWVA